MTAPLNQIPIIAPGGFGLNTEEASAAIDPRWALELANAAFDRGGRASARQGWAYSTAEGNRHSDDTEAIFEYLQDDGTTWVVSAAGNKLYTSDDAVAVPDPEDLNDRTGTNTPTDNHWQFRNHNGAVIGFQAGHIPQYLADPATGATNFADIDTTNSPAGTTDASFGNCGCTAAGRIWVTDDTETIIQFSIVQANPASMDWTVAGTGTLDTAEVWPDGLDRVVAIEQWQDKLAIFGSRSILIYSGLADPANDLALVDTIPVGCIARDSVAVIGTDILFLARDGLRSLARAIQYEDFPLQQLSRPVRQALVADIQNASSAADIKCAYSRRHALYIARIQSSYWAFDVRAPLERGELRASKWFGFGAKSLHGAADGTLYLGQTGGVATYSGYLDNTSTYQFRYRSTWVEPAQGQTVIAKYAIVTVDTPGNYSVSLRWAFDFIEDWVTGSAQLEPTRTVAEWNVAEWGVSEWSGGATTVKRLKVPMTRWGDRMQFGVTVNVNGQAFALSRIDLFAKAGRLAA